MRYLNPLHALMCIYFHNTYSNSPLHILVKFFQRRKSTESFYEQCSHNTFQSRSFPSLQTISRRASFNSSRVYTYMLSSLFGVRSVSTSSMSSGDELNMLPMIAAFRVMGSETWNCAKNFFNISKGCRPVFS